METTESAVARNVAGLREQRRHTVRSLSAKLGELGRPILPSGVTKIENQDRRVDVGDLVALAMALGVNPNRLLLPVDFPPDAIKLTSTIEVSQMEAWLWALGRQPLWTVIPPEQRRAAEDDFWFHALPPDERVRERNAAIQAAQALIKDIRDLLVKDEEPGYLSPALRDVPRRDVVATLRATLRRLAVEVEDLIGDGDER